MIDEIHGICSPKCSDCPAWKATHEGTVENREALAAEWTASLGKVFTADDILCDGCRVQDGRKSSYWYSCEIKLCADEKGHDTCAHCTSCPCEKIVAPPAQQALRELMEQTGRD